MNQPVNWESPVSQPEPKRKDWLTIAQLVFSGFFTLAYGAAAVALLTHSLPEISQVITTDPTPLSSYSMGFFCAILALFNLASTYYSGKKLKSGDDSIRTEKRLKWLNGILIVVPILIVIGVLVFPSESIRNYLLPVLTSLIIVIGVVWLIKLGSGESWGAHAQRDSGLISLMTGFTIWFIMFLEIMVLVIVGIILLIGLINKPELIQQLNTLANLIETQSDPSQVLQTLQGMVSTPTLFGLAFLIVVVIMPIIEELFKTLGVWILAGRNLSPQEGWVAGLMSGAGFALVEGLFYSVQMVTLPDSFSWVVAVVGRTGGSLLHTFCGGLIGWALAKTWKDRKVWRVVGMFVVVILIHGFWNGLALIPTISTLGGLSEAADNLYFLPLILLMVGLFIGYTSTTRKVAGQA
ncbi:MAG: PrsW family glutamic-type intramembrane protease [Anaerolineaceae bacterium]